jgi:hypothetical protein
MLVLLMNETILSEGFLNCTGSDLTNGSRHQFSALGSSVVWTWVRAGQCSRRRCLIRRTPQSFLLLIITIIITAAICLPPGDPTGNLTSTQLCYLDLLRWEEYIYIWGMDYVGRGVKYGRFGLYGYSAWTTQVILIHLSRERLHVGIRKERYVCVIWFSTQNRFKNKYIPCHIDK